MAKSILVPEKSIIEMLKALPEDALIEIFSKVLIESDTYPLSAEEEKSYKKALEERERGKVINWGNLR